MYFYRVLSLSMCKESKDKLCYSNVLTFRPLYVRFMQTAVFFVVLKFFFIYILHSNRSSRFLLFIVDCNNSDNRKKVQHFLFVFALTELVCVIMAFSSLLEADLQEYSHRIFLQKPIKKTFLVKPFCAGSVTLTCAFPFVETSSRSWSFYIWKCILIGKER